LVSKFQTTNAQKCFAGHPFENYDIAHAPLRSVDGLEADYQLLIDIRSFEIKSDPDASAEIAFSARILAKNGHVVASRLFSERRKLEKTDPVSAVTAFDDAFGTVATELSTWTAAELWLPVATIMSLERETLVSLVKGFRA
jgi:phospholipid/cholesterol/gamma-HCH transport system substrate-binding protein